MRIVLVGNGWLPIPPPSWGAVEILIWDLYNLLKKKGHEVLIVNTNDMDSLIYQANNFQPDIVHLHSENYYKVLDKINALQKYVTCHHSHLQFLNSIDFHTGNYKICALSDNIKQKFINANCDPNKLLVTPNGIDHTKFQYNSFCVYPEKSICLGMIEERKKQYKYQNISSLYFAGELQCNKFMNKTNYLGQWTKEQVYSFLTIYANLVLLSESEAHSLAVSEALICGLGVVVSEAASANLDISKEWITVIPNDKLDDIAFVEQKIHENREISVKHREEIRKHSLETISWDARISIYEQMYLNK
jgi:glycosyltransferase involved in cell wall biosynthesis